MDYELNFQKMKILNFFLAIMFLLFAFLQVNDPDPLIWISIYGVMAVLAILAMFKIYPRRIILILLVLFTAYSLVYFPGVKEWLHQENKSDLFDNVAKMNHLYIEESREFLGLWICIAVLIFYFIRARRV
jgi:hypothetical protein